jgi:hypothetical protein
VDLVNLGTIKSVPIQHVWSGEATVFTPWLASNLHFLAEKLGMEFIPETTETPVGDFSADIVARDPSTSRLVIIGNQFGRSDQRHLGQILTYAAGLGASTVIWVAENIRPEHRTAIDLLNRGMRPALRFYAVEISVIRIDDSRPAFTLDAICEPEENESISSVTNGGRPNEKAQMYLAFSQGLIDELYSRQFTKARKAQPQSWYAFSSENSSVFTYMVSFARHKRARTEVYIDCGDGTLDKVIIYSTDQVQSLDAKSLGWLH